MDASLELTTRPHLDKTKLALEKNTSIEDWLFFQNQGIEILRQTGQENMAGLHWAQQGLVFTRGIIFPWLSSEGKGLDSYLKDMVVTTIVPPGANRYAEKVNSQTIAEITKPGSAKLAIFGIGGWGESDLAIQSIYTDLAIALQNQFQNAFDIRIFLLSHSGSRFSYRENADLSKITWVDEYDQIQAGIQRILDIYQLESSDVYALGGHSKGGLFAKQLQMSGRFPNAAFAYQTPAIVGKNLPPELYANWLKKYLEPNNVKTPPVLLQQGLGGLTIEAVLKMPEGKLRKFLMKIGMSTKIMPNLTEYFMGISAAHKDKALAVIADEIINNKRAMQVQQNSLKNMPMIMPDGPSVYTNPELVLAAGRDTTLASAFQEAFMYEIAARSENPIPAIEIAKRARSSGHNLDQGTIHVMIDWLLDEIKKTSEKTGHLLIPNQKLSI